MMGFILVFLLLAFGVGEAAEFKDITPSFVRTVDDFALYDQAGNFHQLYSDSDQKAIVLISYGIGCPIARKSIATVEKLNKQFSAKGILFFFIDSNSDDDRDALLQEAKDYHIDLPLLEDSTGLVAESLQIMRTAEAVVVDTRSWEIVYQGPIDDQFGYESARDLAQQNYLADALQAVIEHRPVEKIVRRTKGCLLSRHLLTPLTYTKDIAPILRRKCLSCHSQGGVAPWHMNGYQKVRRWGPMIREVIRTRRMPPWHADAQYGKFNNDLSLSLEDQRKIVQWVEHGMLKGSGPDSWIAQKSTLVSEWQLGTPDIIFSLKDQQEIVETGQDAYLLLESDRPVEKDLWLRAFELKPGNVRVVHHSNIVIQQGVKKQIQSQGELSDQTQPLSDDQEQWFYDSGLSSVNMDDGQVIAGYSPGMGAVELPQDTGIFVPKGSRVLFYMHYITTGKIEHDRTKVGFYLLKQKPQHILSVATITNRGIHILAGQKNYSLKGSYTFDEDVLLTALQPHMHYRGKSMRFTAFYPDGTSEILLSVPHYQFAWQRQYVLAVPKSIPKGTQIILEGSYDNSNHNLANPNPAQEVYYGPGSAQEMFTGIMFYIKNGNTATKGE